jgi:hypothetical protein
MNEIKDAFSDPEQSKNEPEVTEDYPIFDIDTSSMTDVSPVPQLLTPVDPTCLVEAYTRDSSSSIAVAPFGQSKFSLLPNVSNSPPDRVITWKNQKPDARPDPFDQYPYTTGHFYDLCMTVIEKELKMVDLFVLCTKIEKHHNDPIAHLLPLSPRNRAAKRRMANAYAWLEINKDVISDAEFLQYLPA